MKGLRTNFYKVNSLLEGNISNFLDLIRGLSAILVVMEHLSSRLLLGYGYLENPNLFVKFLYLLNMLGNPAVIIFFVLSGLFISRSVINLALSGKWTWKTYLINRFSRLYVVLLPALLITFVLDLITSKYFGYHSYGNVLKNIEDFVGNLFFLQNITVNVYGSNAPLWSLNYEFWYYILFPLIMLLTITKQGVVSKIIQLIAITFIMTFVGVRMNLYFIIWLVGALVLILPRFKLLTGKFTPLFALFLVLLTVSIHPLVMTGRLFTQSWTSDPYILNLMIGISFGFLIYSLMHSKSKLINIFHYIKIANFSKIIASFSFSLYLIHYPIINTAYYLAKEFGFLGLQPNLVSVLMEILLVSLICIIAFLFSRITEGRTHVVRKFVQTKMNGMTGSRYFVLRKQKKIG